MKHDRFTKFLLSAITVLLVANLLVSLRVTPSIAQQAQRQLPKCQVIIVPDSEVSNLISFIEGKGENGYHLKGIAANNTHFVAVLER